MSGTPTVIYHAASAQQAHILKGVLEERGIASWVVNDNIQVAGGELPIGWTAAACVAVGSLDAAEARQIAEEFDRTTAHEPTPDVPAAPAPQEWQDWPVCPQCQSRRQVQCSICGSSGTDFPLADVIESGGENIVLLICSSCDDHFRPEMFRLCPRCGHDFGDGISFESASQSLDSSPRTWVVLGVMLAGAAILAAYFYALWG